MGRVITAAALARNNLFFFFIQRPDTTGEKWKRFVKCRTRSQTGIEQAPSHSQVQVENFQPNSLHRTTFYKKKKRFLEAGKKNVWLFSAQHDYASVETAAAAATAMCACVCLQNRD